MAPWHHHRRADQLGQRVDLRCGGDVASPGSHHRRPARLHGRGHRQRHVSPHLVSAEAQAYVFLFQ